MTIQDFHFHFSVIPREKLLSMTVPEWLDTLGLGQAYAASFAATNLFASMDRVAEVWDDELTSILDVGPVGHRKRMLLSLVGGDVGKMEGRFGKVEKKEGIRGRHKRVAVKEPVKEERGDDEVEDMEVDAAEDEVRIDLEKLPPPASPAAAASRQQQQPPQPAARKPVPSPRRNIGPQPAAAAGSSGPPPTPPKPKFASSPLRQHKQKQQAASSASSSSSDEQKKPSSQRYCRRKCLYLVI